MPLRIPSTVISLLLIFLTGAVAAQPRPSEEIKSLQKQIDDLRETQQGIQKELQEIKRLLQGRGGSPNVPPANVTVSVDGSPFKGDENAKLILVEFSD